MTGAVGRNALVIRHGHVMTMDRQLGDMPDADVHIDGGRIAAVGPALHVPGARLLDARGMIVAPGLVDTHWHMWNTLLRSMSGDGPKPGYFRVSVGLMMWAFLSGLLLLAGAHFSATRYALRTAREAASIADAILRSL